MLVFSKSKQRIWQPLSQKYNETQRRNLLSAGATALISFLLYRQQFLAKNPAKVIHIQARVVDFGYSLVFIALYIKIGINTYLVLTVRSFLRRF